MCSKRDYIAVARVIRDETEDIDVASSTPASEAVARIASGVATHFEENNPAFDRVRFLSACGVKTL